MANTKKSADKPPASLDDIIAQAKPVERVVDVCVAGDLVAEHQRLEAELERVQHADTNLRLGQKPEAPKVAERIQDVQARMREHTHTFRFRALSPKAWSDLIAAHEDPKGKRAFNVDTFPAAAIAACCVEPPGMGDPEKVAKLLEVLSPAQQSDLFDGAWDVNTQAPKETTSYAASAVLAASATNSPTARLSESQEASSSDA